MNLTPIRIRGKRRVPKTQHQSAALDDLPTFASSHHTPRLPSSAASDHDLASPSPLRTTFGCDGRPSSISRSSAQPSQQKSKPAGKLGEQQPESTKQRGAQPAPAVAKRPKHRRVEVSSLSKLEKLPTELLQSIFLRCGNVALPRSSLYLGGQLSSDFVCTQALVLALQASMPPATGACEPKPSPAQFQASTIYHEGCMPRHEAIASHLMDLLSCRMVTWERYSSALRQAYKLQFGKLVSVQEDWPVPEYREPLELLEEKKHSRLPFSLDLDDLPYYMTLPNCFRKMPNTLRIPDRLLRGPWTQDDTNLLYLLTWVGIPIDWEFSTAGEIATASMLDAIRQENLLVVGCLLKGGVFPTAHMIRVAVIEVNFNRNIIICLLTKALSRPNDEQSIFSDVDFQDAALWAWADRQRDTEESNAKWLMKALRAAETISVTPGRIDRKDGFGHSKLWVEASVLEYG